MSRSRIIGLAAVLVVAVGLAIGGTMVVRREIADREASPLRVSDFSKFENHPRFGFLGNAGAVQSSRFLWSRCEALAELEKEMARSSVSTIGGSIATRGPEEVSAVVLEHPGESSSAVLDEIQQGIDSCESAEGSGDADEELRDVEGLPHDAVGYRYDAFGNQGMDRAYAATPDGRLLIVTVTTGLVAPFNPTDGQSRIQPPITLDFMLKTAMPRVGEVAAK